MKTHINKTIIIKINPDNKVEFFVNCQTSLDEEFLLPLCTEKGGG